jgi:hypothetical protein
MTSRWCYMIKIAPVPHKVPSSVGNSLHYHAAVTMTIAIDRSRSGSESLSFMPRASVTSSRNSGYSRRLNIGISRTGGISTCLGGSLSRLFATGPDISYSLSRPTAVTPNSPRSRHVVRPSATARRAAIELALTRLVPPNPTTRVAAPTMRISPNNALAIVKGGELPGVFDIHAGVVRAEGIAVVVGWLSDFAYTRIAALVAGWGDSKGKGRLHVEGEVRLEVLETR